jgi:hypothetical protein
MAGVKNEELVREIRRKGIISAKRMFELANEFADGEDTINASLGKYKRNNNNKQASKAPSSPKRKDHKHKDDFIGNTEKVVAIGRSRAIRISSRRS